MEQAQEKKPAGIDKPADNNADEIAMQSEPPVLPDGIGLDYETVRKLLRDKNNVISRLDEPVMMIVTILNAGLGEMAKLGQFYETRLSKILAECTEDYVEEVKTTTKELGAVLSRTSIVAIKDILTDHSLEMRENRNSGWWCAVIIAVAGLANLAALAYMAFWKR
jgi:hypothetical protein